MRNKDFKDLLTSIKQARRIHSCKVKKVKLTKEEKLISWLRRRIRLLENARQHYGQNPTLAKNLKIANSVLIENDIEDLKKLLDTLICH